VHSLRSQLLRRLVLPLLALWCFDAWFTFKDSVDEVNIGFDRTLAGSALMMAERVATEDGRLTVDIPIAAIQMLENAFRDRIYYRVVDLASGTLVTGYEDLPPPPQIPSPETPLFYYAPYKGAPVRFVALLRPVFDPVAKGPALIQVGESTSAREAQARRILVETAVKELAAISLVGALLWLGVRRGLRPLQVLRDRVLARGAHDLSPIALAAVPREVVPLIEAINSHTERQHAMNEAQRQFIADASHQLKTPLTVLKTQAELALRQTELPAMRELVQRMLASTDATARMVQQLLLLARSDEAVPVALELLDLAVLARNTTLEMSPRALAQGVDLGYEGTEHQSVMGHAVLLRELVLNLLDNALRYLPGAGRVTVRVVTGSDGTVLEVEDNGPGIKPEVRANLTRRFYRGGADPTGAGGAGLGLAIVAGIADRHQARLAFDDTPGGTGLRVLVLFPPVPGPAPV
jgi:two-component system sensor histidine kinase TctE